MKKHAVLLVRKCLDRQFCESFQNFLTVRTHEQNTRNNGCMLEVLKVKLQVAKSRFRSIGVKIYNDLPMQSRQTDSQYHREGGSQGKTPGTGPHGGP